MSGEGDASDDFVYQFRPRAIGPAHAFRIGTHSLEWDLAGRRGRVAYPMIARIRLAYRPSNFGTRRFIAEIWPRNDARVEIASASFRSLVSTDDQLPSYRTFVRELHRRIVEAGGDCRFEAGLAAWRWWPMAAVGAAASVALLVVAVQTIGRGDFAGAVVVAAFIALFAWQMLPLIRRNRPRRYDPRAIPEEVLPSS
jgi:hypothetical protein